MDDNDDSLCRVMEESSYIITKHFEDNEKCEEELKMANESS